MTRRRGGTTPGSADVQARTGRADDLRSHPRARLPFRLPARAPTRCLLRVPRVAAAV